MMCEICGVRKASIKFTQIANAKKKELHLCKVCAEEKGYTDPLSSFPKLLGDLILGILAALPAAKREKIDLNCSECQLSWNDFQDTGLFGCGACYESFSEQLQPLLRRLHGSNTHIGNRPPDKRIDGTTNELKRLKSELDRAIKIESFEQAAELRDKIRDIEANSEKQE
jgi:protein arginine kinase activator